MPAKKGDNKLTPMAREYRNLQYEPLMLRAVALLDGHKLSQIQRDCGVTANTLRNWRNKKTHRPNSSTLRFVGRALGFKLDFIPEE